ncbi:MAG: type II toxin-antitoxin system Phd/YefM family antitoxin [Pseudomonadota bacterium]
MSRRVNIHEAKTQLSKLIECARLGEDVVIAKNGEPVVRLAAIEPAKRKRRPMGYFRGKIVVHPSFDDPLPEDIRKYFEGRG